MLVDSGQEWTFDALEDMFMEVERIAREVQAQHVSKSD